MSDEGNPLLEGSTERQAGSNLPAQRRTRSLALVFTVALHLIVITALLWMHAGTATTPVESETSLEVSLLDRPKPPGPPDTKKPGALENAVQPIAPKITAPVVTMVAPDTSDLLSESQLAGAASAGEGGGGGGGGCDMARAVQQALRRDALVHRSVEDAGRLGKAIMMWNGDWVRSGDQDGKGLSAVRQAITWAIAFAPEACRNQRVHGLVVMSLADQSTRFAVGTGDWRWSDLLGLRAVPSNN